MIKVWSLSLKLCHCSFLYPCTCVYLCTCGCLCSCVCLFSLSLYVCLSVYSSFTFISAFRSTWCRSLLLVASARQHWQESVGGKDCFQYFGGNKATRLLGHQSPLADGHLLMARLTWDQVQKGAGAVGTKWAYSWDEKVWSRGTPPSQPWPVKSCSQCASLALEHSYDAKWVSMQLEGVSGGPSQDKLEGERGTFMRGGGGGIAIGGR